MAREIRSSHRTSTIENLVRHMADKVKFKGQNVLELKYNSELELESQLNNCDSYSKKELEDYLKNDRKLLKIVEPNGESQFINLENIYIKKIINKIFEEKDGLSSYKIGEIEFKNSSTIEIGFDQVPVMGKERKESAEWLIKKKLAESKIGEKTNIEEYSINFYKINERN
jgi:hypothetical protein